MRVNPAIASAILVACLATSPPAQTRDATCQVLVERAEYQKVKLERAGNKLVSLLRIAGEQEKRRIERFVAEMHRQTEIMGQRFQDLGARFSDPACDQACIDRLCRANRAALHELINDIAAQVEAVRAFEVETREMLARAGRVEYAIRSTDRMIYRASQPVRGGEEGGDERIYGELRKAFEVQEDAKRAAGVGRYEAALKLTLEARDLVGRVVRAAIDAEDAAAMRQRATEYCAQTKRMIDRLDRGLGKDARAQAVKLLDMARRENERGCESIEEQPYRAIRSLSEARKIVGRMIRFHQRAGELGDRMERFEERLEAAAGIVESADNGKANELLNRGRRHYEKADKLVEDGDVIGATAQLDVAAKLIAASVDIVRGDTPRAKGIEAQLRQTVMIVRRASAVAQTDEQKALVERARILVEEASAQNDNQQACLRLLDKATDIAFRVVRLGRGDAWDDSSRVIEDEGPGD